VHLLSLVQLETLGEGLLEFNALSDLEKWLHQLEQQQREVIARLTQQLGELGESATAQIRALSLLQLTEVASVLPELTTPEEISAWLQIHTGNGPDSP